MRPDVRWGSLLGPQTQTSAACSRFDPDCCRGWGNRRNLFDAAEVNPEDVSSRYTSKLWLMTLVVGTLLNCDLK